MSDFASGPPDAESNAEQLVGSNTDSLYGVIDRQNVHGLNLTVPEDAKETIKPWADRESVSKYADSNVDDQMIIHVPFSQNVRLKSLLLKLGPEPMNHLIQDGESLRLDIFAYTPITPNIIDFSDAESTKPSLNISLQEGETSVTEYPLRVASFANVSSVSLYFDDAVGGESSRVYYIGFKGDTRQYRKEGTNKLEIPAANAADAPLVDRVSERNAAQQPTAK